MKPLWLLAMVTTKPSCLPKLVRATHPCRNHLGLLLSLFSLKPRARPSPVASHSVLTSFETSSGVCSVQDWEHVIPDLCEAFLSLREAWDLWTLPWQLPGDPTGCPSPPPEQGPAASHSLMHACWFLGETCRPTPCVCLTQWPRALSGCRIPLLTHR